MNYFDNSMARYEKTLAAIPSDISSNPDSKILDIGGYKVFEKMLADKFGFNNIETYATNDLNIDKFIFADDTFDLVILGEVIEHLYDPDVLLRECNRILKKNGVLLITTPNLTSWYNRILLFFGFYPMNLDISCEVRKSGKRDILQKKDLSSVTLNPLYDVHIKLYTFKTLEILLSAHNFTGFVKSSYSLEKSAHYKIGWPLRVVNRHLGKIHNLAQGVIIIGRKK